MTQADLDKVRASLAALELLLARAQAGTANDDALLEFRRHCWSTLLLTHDAECHERIELLVQHAKDLYSGQEGHRLDLLRGKIRMVLSGLRARLESLGGYGKRWRDLRAA